MLAENTMQTNEWIDIVSLDDIPQMGSRVIKSQEMNIAIFRTAKDEVFAVKDECPHKQGPLSQGIVHGKTVTCPLHNWRIDLANGEAQGPDEGCTNTFPVKVENNRIHIKLIAQ